MHGSVLRGGGSTSGQGGQISICTFYCIFARFRSRFVRVFKNFLEGGGPPKIFYGGGGG